MSKVRINDLARELEVKSKAILDTLPLVGVTEKKTHSSSLEEHEAEKVRVYIRSSAEGSSAAENAIYLPMSFISGAFFSPHSFPQFLRAIADVLPLTYFIRLTRDVMLRGDQLWQEPGPIAVIAAWGLVGAIVAIRGFRWEPAEG